MSEEKYNLIMAFGEFIRTRTDNFLFVIKRLYDVKFFVFIIS